MLFAKNQLKQRIKITESTDTKAVCPTCEGEVIAKRGRIKVWHWAHVAIDECDAWSESESEWHRSWKELLPDHQVEVTIEKDWWGKRQKHRADIEATDGTVIELQHSSISTDEIEERESFYGRMAWIFDLKDVWEAERFELEEHGNYSSFRWKHPRKHIAHAEATCYLHFGNNQLFLLKKMYIDGPCRGWGRFVDIDNLVEQWQRPIGPRRYTH